MGQETESRGKKPKKIRSAPKPHDVADRVVSYIQGHFKVGQSLPDPINISFSEPQQIFNEKSDSFTGGFYYYAYILKNAYKYQISITVDHDPMKKHMPTKWDVSYAVKRFKKKLSLFDKLTGAKAHYSKYIRGGHLKTIDTEGINADELVMELSVTSIYLLEDLTKNYIDGEPAPD